MTNKRALTEQEKRISQANLERIKDEVDYTQASLRQTEVSIENAPIIYKHQFNDLQKKKKELTETIAELNKTVNILNDQIKNGVSKK